MVGEDNTCKGIRPITEEDCENHHIPSKFGVIMDGKRKNMEDYYERLKQRIYDGKMNLED